MIKKNSNFQKIIFAWTESFVALLPFFVLSSLSIVAYEAFTLFANDSDFLHHVKNGSQVAANIFPVLLVISISYHLGRMYGIGVMVSIALALTTYLIIVSLNQQRALPNLSIDGQLSFLALFIPLLTTYVIVLLSIFSVFRIEKYSVLGRNLSRLYQDTFIFVAGFFLVITLFSLLAYLSDSILIEKINLDDYQPMPAFALTILRELIAAVINFFGPHGVHTLGLFVDDNYLREFVFDNLTVDQMMILYAGYGGVGSVLSLIIAILACAKSGYPRTVAKLAFPFAIFNVSEIIVYGLPLIFNRRLFIPFVFVQLVNLVLAYLVLNLGYISFVPASIPWSVPIFINAYLLTGGNWLAVLLQAALLLLDVYLYLPFVKGYLKNQSSSEHLISLEKKLDLQFPIQARDTLKFHQAQMYILNAHSETRKVIELVTSNELTIHYQPKIDAKSLKCNHMEALLRMRMSASGEVVGPYFLDELAQAGLQPTIDYWVCIRVANDIKSLSNLESFPQISINLHSDTLQERHVIQKIADILSGLNIEFELVEKAFIDARSRGNIEYLVSRGFTMAIDDFGTGYSSLESLNKIPANVVKLDKGLIDNSSTAKGKIIYSSACAMCKRLGFILVAEGVETEEQFELVKAESIDYVQGFYFSKALPFDIARQFIVTQNEVRSQL